MLRIFFFVLASAHAAGLPEGPGRAETLKHCGRCHSLDQSVSLRQPRAGWTETITKMVNLGVQGSEQELNVILDYLAKHYGAAGTDGIAVSNRAAKAGHAYGLDPGAVRFSPLKQLTPETVAKLKVAWVYHVRPEG
jgi:quinoprotein glucose dehydrogenase